MYTYKAELVRVVDGDTIDCIIDLGFDIKLKERVRLKGIDAPETRTKDLNEKKFGNAAKERLKQLLLDEFILTTERKGSRGKYGRLIGTLMVNNININEQMVREGHAVQFNE
jgi:micrococcal nuclease|tara:strand:+ start:52 stop:387 length:336 start_codon:yes stop_codon:yes gene_type:complete